METQSPPMLVPAMISGAVFGFVSAIPLVGALNCLCCSLILGCGFLAAFLYSRSCQQAGAEFRPGTGAVVGLLAGLFYAVAATVFGAVVQLAMGMGDPQQVVEMLEQMPNMDPEIIDQAARFLESTGPAVLVAIGLGVNLVFGAIFSAIGGLIGGAVFKRETRVEV